ncbi:MAG: methylmalonyl-CoA mutase family protein, partial [Acidimicrobiales bacterium]
MAERDRPWLIRTYSGHSSARASNELYRTNLAKGQTGLSVAFDLPTQTGYDPDAREAAGEVGKVGVPVAHLGHMTELMAGIPVAEMNTSMTINATAAWLLGLYVANAQGQGVDPAALQGTTQNDIVKEYLSRGTFIFPPEPSLRLTVDTIAYTVHHVPKWNPVNVCSYHLQEAGATPVQELAYALATAIGILDAVRGSGKVRPDDLPRVVGRISFFVNSGVRFVEETCKMRAFTAMWDRICRERYGVEDPKLRRFRYGVQVNSLGLTEQQPENNVPRIVLETLGVTLSADARARAIQLPAWNEAMGLPRPWDQQWSLRVQQILAYESDLLDYADLFEGSKVVEAKTAELVEAASTELADVLALGGAFAAIEDLKTRLVKSQAERVRRIETGEQKVVGVNCFTETAPSPLTADEGAEHILKVDPTVQARLQEDVVAWRSQRDAAAVGRSLAELRRVAGDDRENIMAATIALAHAGGTTGEWAGVLREMFGEYRAPTGVAGAVGRRAAATAGTAGTEGPADDVRARVRALAEWTGGPPRLLVAKPGLDGHSNG